MQKHTGIFNKNNIVNHKKRLQKDVSFIPLSTTVSSVLLFDNLDL